MINRFVIVGIFAVSIDYMSYNIFAEFLAINLAKGLSFVIGAIFAFVMNKLWTFQDNSSYLMTSIKFSILYTISLFINVKVNEYSLILFHSNIAFLIATGCSAASNFIGMKFLVFKKS